MSEEFRLRMSEAETLPPSVPVEAKLQSTILAPEEVDVTAAFDESVKKQESHESPLKAVIGGALGALLSAFCLASLAALTGVWIRWMSIGIGFAVAFGVRWLGKGNNARFGVIGATWAFVGCILSYHFAWCIVLAQEQQIGVFEFIRGLNSVSDLMVDVLGPRDFAIYAAAMFAGYKFSYNCVADQY